MNLVLISGSHPRHLYLVRKMIETQLVSGIVFMKREEMIVDSPVYLSGDLRKLYEKHFLLRASMEDRYFGRPDISLFYKKIPCIEIERNELNSKKVEDFIRSVAGSCLLSYGPDLIKENILQTVDGFAFNLHGGLSPWYKGSATMFWPFYFLEPNYVGTTLHYITKKIDAGNIVQQTVPKLEHGDCMHEVSCKAVVKACEETKQVFIEMGKGRTFPGVPQKKNGKLFLDRDWRPEHLRVVYETFHDRIVDMFLDGEISRRENPDLVSVL